MKRHPVVDVWDRTLEGFKDGVRWRSRPHGVLIWGNSPDEPLRLASDDRRELVGKLAHEGMSTRAIAPIVGVDKDTVRRDLISTGANTPPDGDPEVGDAEPAPTPAPITGIDGKTYTRPATVAPRAAPRRAFSNHH